MKPRPGLEVELRWPTWLKYVGFTLPPATRTVPFNCGSRLKVAVPASRYEPYTAYVFDIMCDNPNGQPPYWGRYVHTEVTKLDDSIYIETIKDRACDHLSEQGPMSAPG